MLSLVGFDLICHVCDRGVLSRLPALFLVCSETTGHRSHNCATLDCSQPPNFS